MKKSDIVFLTTIFPAVKNFLPDFFDSLESQTSKDFDLLVINDGVSDFSFYDEKYPNLNIIEYKFSQSPAKNREYGIKKCIELNYEYIIFGDSDDFFSKNRIENSIKALRFNDLVVNELNIYSSGECINNFFAKNLKKTHLLRGEIIDSNIFGFSNIALRKSIINVDFSFSNKLIAVDWFFVSSLLIKEKINISFLKDVYTYYRQHDNNLIGMSLFLTKKKLNLGLNVKQSQYTQMIKYCRKNKLNSDEQIFKRKLYQILKLREKLEEPLFENQYLKRVNVLINDFFSGWWSEILTIEDLYEYEKLKK
ncbi:MAG: glycosyltransferase [Bacteroidales bacterium]|nr:glycosyltransferase [Bacteroidales bacterium]